MRRLKKSMSDQESRNYDRLIKALRIASTVIMAAMLALVIYLMVKYDISLKNADSIADRLTGGALTVALIIIGFSVVKSFALIFPPALIFAVSGIFFEKLWMAILVNFIATVLSLILPYYLGKLTGAGMLDSLKRRFPKIAKLDAFAGRNEFGIVLVVKASGMLPSDLSSLIFGAMGMSFPKYFIAANIGMLPLNVLWALLGNKGDLTDPFSYLYVLPILIFAVVAAVVMNKLSKKPAATDTKE